LDGRQLVFVFQDKSWVEVKDAAQRIIFTGEHPAGSRQSVTGKAPFQLWVGKASGVKVFDGEREIDLKPYARDEVARLTID
jgi:cytoskeleton protein RodZ